MNKNQSTSAEPTLKVMRLQSPELAMSSTSSAFSTSGGGCDSGISSSFSSSNMSNSLILPDSFGLIHIGETFTAYLGVINVHPSESVTNLSVSATLQTPTRRWSLPNPLQDERLSSNSPTNNKKMISSAKSSEDTMDSDGELAINIPPLGGVDAIVSRFLEEVGQHILRVEVSYGGPILSKHQQQQWKQQQQMYAQQGLNTTDLLANRMAPAPRKSIRKFYRFHVSSPLNIQDLTLRCGESSCFVSLTVENTAPLSSSTGIAGGNGAIPSGGASAGSFLGGALTIFQAEFQPFPGLIAQRIHTNTLSSSITSSGSKKVKSAVELFDECGRLGPGESYRFLFHVQASSREATARCIAKGDELGKVIVTWRKAMGEVGRIASTFVYCPVSALEFESLSSSTKVGNMKSLDSKKIQKGNIVVHGSGFSADVSSAAAQKSTSSHHHAPSEVSSVQTIDDFYPITVEPVNPPSSMNMGEPINVRLLIVNHTSKVKTNLQLQMRLIHMKGVVVYGHAFQNLDTLQPNGGSTVIDVKLLGMVPGLFHVSGCTIVDLNSGMEVDQPPLFSVYVNRDNDQ